MDHFLKRGKRRNSPQKRKNKISNVWKYFKRSDDKKFAKCLNCDKEYKTSGNTSNLRDHLKRFHPNLNFNAPDFNIPNADSQKSTSSKKAAQKRKNKISNIWKHFKRSDDKKFAKCLNCHKEYKTSGNTSNLRDHLKRFHPNVNSNSPDFNIPDADSEKSSSSKKPAQKRKNKISNVWKYFKRSDDKKFAKCLNCDKEYKTSGNTSNLRDHLKRFHPNLNFNAPDFNIPDADSENNASTSSSCRSSMRSVDSYFTRAVIYEANSKRKKDIDKILTEMVAEDVQPFSKVENQGFIKYSRVLDPRYKLPSRTHLRDVLMANLFKETSAKLSTILEEISDIAITCDLWTSSANVSFLTVTGHFVHEYGIKTASLATKKLKDHSPQNIADALKEILTSWKVFEKTVCIVSDNASSMLKACENLKIPNLPCFAHTINLVVQDGLKLDHNDITKALFSKCKTIVQFFKQSSIANEKLKLFQENFEYTLLQETTTRWNSFHIMIERILATHEEIASVLLSTPNAPLPFTVEEINVLKDIEKILVLFKKVSEKASGEKYVTISLIIPLAYGLYRQIQNLSPQLVTAVGESIKDAFLESIKKRLSTYEDRTVTRMATILDPRFKKDGFQFNSNAEQAATFLENDLVNLTNNKNPINSNVEANTTTKDALFDFLDQRSTSKKRNVRSDAIIIKTQYLERGIAPQEMDPLLWIKVYQTDFPLLKLLMFKYLCIPATSVESERIFSQTGQIISDRRIRLKEENVNVLLFLNKNLWLSTPIDGTIDHYRWF